MVLNIVPPTAIAANGTAHVANYSHIGQCQYWSSDIGDDSRQRECRNHAQLTGVDRHITKI